MSSAPNKLVIVLGTTSVLKLGAIQGAFDQAKSKIATTLGLEAVEFVFVTTNAKSEVNEQPVGWEETITGANNRAKNALGLAQLEATPRFVIAIENGVVEVAANGLQYYMDIGWVVMNDLLTTKKYFASSTSLTVPVEVLEAAKARDLKTTTIGDIMHERDPSINKKDPHSSLLGGVMTRVPLMQQAVLSCIGQFIYDASVSKSPSS